VGEVVIRGRFDEAKWITSDILRYRGVDIRPFDPDKGAVSEIYGDCSIPAFIQSWMGAARFVIFDLKTRTVITIYEIEDTATVRK
jgi:hypothetical protein